MKTLLYGDGKVFFSLVKGPSLIIEKILELLKSTIDLLINPELVEKSQTMVEKTPQIIEKSLRFIENTQN